MEKCRDPRLRIRHNFEFLNFKRLVTFVFLSCFKWKEKILFRKKKNLTQVQVPSVRKGNFRNAQSLGGANDRNFRCIQTETCNCPLFIHCEFSGWNKFCVSCSRLWVQATNSSDRTQWINIYLPRPRCPCCHMRYCL